MKINSIIDRYIFKEMLSPFAINLIFFSFVFLMAKILEITNLIVNYQVSLVSVLLMLIYTMPYFLEFVIPMSVMMAVLLTFLRLSADNEIIALKSGGVSVYRLLPPVMAFCLLGCMITAFISVYALPWGSRSFKDLVVNVASSNMDIGLKERTFNDRFKGVMLYVNEIRMKDKMMKDIFIEDQRAKDSTMIIVAPEGRLLTESDRNIWHLSLRNGFINQVSRRTRTANSIFFDRYDLRLDLPRTVSEMADTSDKVRELNFSELKKYLRNADQQDDRYYLALIEFHKKFSISFACLALGLLAVPLGIQSRSRKRSYGIAFGLMFFLMYYLMLAAGKVFGEVGRYPPLIGMWLPNGVIGGLGVYLLIRVANERPVKLDVFTWPVRYLISVFNRAKSTKKSR